MIRRALAVIAACFSLSGVFAQTITTQAITPSTYCQGASITVKYTIVGSFNPGNVFTAEISQPGGTFPGTAIGSVTSQTAVDIVGTIPGSVGAANTYKVRVTASDPNTALSIQSPTTVTVTAAMAPPTISGTQFCAGGTFGVKVNVNCPISTSPVQNDFTVELSDGTGSFASPTVLNPALTNNTGSTNPTMFVNIPPNISGTAYRVRVRASNGNILSPQNASALTISNGLFSTPSVTGTSFCSGGTMQVRVFVTCPFSTSPTQNDFTVELSDATGSFAAATTLGPALTNDTGASNPTMTVNIPAGTPTGTGYRVRIRASNGNVASAQNGSALTINNGSFNGAPTVTGTSFCQGGTMNVRVNVTCPFPNSPIQNDFTVELSDNTGSFAAPTVLTPALTSNDGSSNPTMAVDIPPSTTPGTAYRVRVRASNGNIVSVQNGSALTINAGTLPSAPTFSGTTFCQSANFNVTFAVGCAFQTPNDFTAELSDVTGSFATPKTIGTLTNSTGVAPNNVINVTIPFNSGTGTGFRIRVKASNGNVISPNNASALTINGPGLNAPTVAGGTSQFCRGANFTININASCPFSTTPVQNDFSAELSDQFGSFASAVTIGTTTNSTGVGAPGNQISATIPTNAQGGNGYRIRIRASNGNVVGPINGTNLQVLLPSMNAPTTPQTTYCVGASFNVQVSTFNVGCYPSTNVFTAELSDATGSFASPTVIGTQPQVGPPNFAGNVPVTIPFTVPTGTGYRIRVKSSDPADVSPVSGTDITIRQLGINAPTVSTTTLCQGAAISVAYTMVSCNFPNAPTANQFIAQLSDASGSFASPTNIGTLNSAGNGTINSVIPTSTPGGTGYRIRVVSTNPQATDPNRGTPYISPDNGSNITVQAASGTPATYGNNVWNAYVYSGTAFPITNNVFLGSYTENNLSFNTSSRWVSANGPGTADNSSGSAYAGCAAPTSSYSVSFKRTNFTCGYYKIDVNTHDDDLRIILNGTTIFQHVGGCCDSHTNIYTGFLGPTSQMDLQLINFGGPGSLQMTFTALATPPITATPASSVICTTSSVDLTATGTPGMTFAWTPTTGLTPATGIGATVTAAPGVVGNYTYTVTGTDGPAGSGSGCTVSTTAAVKVVSTTTVPTVTVTNSTPTICSPLTTSTLTASGANTYSWTPVTGITPTTGQVVTASPTTTTLYTVTGSTGTGCKTATASTIVTVQTQPATPTTTFGNNTWNAYVHNDQTLTNYYGFYQEPALSFNTTTKWNTTTGPSSGNASYSGCSVGGTNYSISFKRTNFTCGYYQLNVNYQDDQFVLIVDGVQQFANTAFTTTVQTAVWSGFLNATSQVELQLVNNSGPGRLDIGLAIAPGPQTLSAPVTICASTGTDLTASAPAYPGATYSWSVSPTHPTITFNPGPNQANTRLETTSTTPGGNYTVTSTMTDAGGTGCTATKTVLVKVSPGPTTAVTAFPVSATINCPSQTVSLTATGANTYSWSPATGLSATTGNNVIATPATTTTYTVTGDNNCTQNSATITVTVNVLPDYATVFPTNKWNIYGFNSTTYGTNYQGYYTDNGTGTSGLNFDSQTRYTTTAAPSTVNTTNGTGWTGCNMSTVNYTLSAKRSGFSCGTYTIDIPGHDDYYTLFVNGVQVSQHNSCCDTHTNVWTGVLTPTSTIEYRVINFGGAGYFAINVTKATQPAGTNVWIGATSTDWFDGTNWCPSVPTSTTDALIVTAGTQFQPNIQASGATVRNITITAAVAASGVSPAIPAANLTMGAFNLDVNGDWAALGTLIPGTGTVSFVGSGANAQITGTQTFNNLVINKANGVTIPSGSIQSIGNGGTMTLTNGVVTQSSTALRFLAGSAVTGASNSSYVDGAVTKIGNTPFTFPLGKATGYSPLGLATSPGTVTDSYTATYFHTNPQTIHSNNNRAVTLDHISGSEYWMLTRNSGSTNVGILLGWNANSGGIGNLSQLRVSNWNGSFWADLGNSATTGNSTQGTVSSTLVSPTYNMFTLASTGIGNQLPVVLAGLECGLNSFGLPQIDWITTSEFNSDYFGIERSLDGRSFETIARIKSKGNSQTEQKYTFEDESAPDGQLYYRLKQVDVDGHVVSYEVCSMKVESAGLNIYPNPANSKATVRLHGDDLQELTVINTIGQTVKVPFIVKGSAVEIDLSSLPAGVYFVRVTTGNKSAVLRLVKA